ncbi:hypothetical protein I6F35_22385 [Bradyrhizobium sp. BRP22]|uniref:hypothetical protein n=1 Tax=Bradyrhizobium sp. BRP22 TaxID=2793821 RepID=UPI001CD195C0|nr:hypothetical protein [Bradyrhizobium sp. BRP22]MCA1455918.1 hypothetical protein [Bradyrhizobium sp. BRP22]
MAIVNIKTVNDADFYRRFVYKTIDLVPIDLTGARLRMMLRKNAADVTVWLHLSNGDEGGIAIVDPAAGNFTVLITQEQLERLPVDEYDHSLIMTDAAGTQQTSVWRGTLTNQAGPSR